MREVTGGTRPALDYYAIKKIKIPIPPLLIQKKIAEKIELYYFQSKKLKKEAKELIEEAKREVEEMILE